MCKNLWSCRTCKWRVLSALSIEDIRKALVILPNFSKHQRRVPCDCYRELTLESIWLFRLSFLLESSKLLYSGFFFPLKPLNPRELIFFLSKIGLSIFMYSYQRNQFLCSLHKDYVILSIFLFRSYKCLSNGQHSSLCVCLLVIRLLCARIDLKMLKQSRIPRKKKPEMTKMGGCDELVSCP